MGVARNVTPYKLIMLPGQSYPQPNIIKSNRQTTLTTITNRSHSMVTTVKVSIEIQDGWIKGAQTIGKDEKQL